MQKKTLQKRLQKQRIKREYMKARKKAAASKAAEQAFEKTKNGAVTVARKLQEFARKNAGLLVTVGIMALLLMMIMVSVSSCGAMFADTQSTILAASYLSPAKEIDAAIYNLPVWSLTCRMRLTGWKQTIRGMTNIPIILGQSGITRLPLSVIYPQSIRSLPQAGWKVKYRLFSMRCIR